ncbi:hypothetical protein BYT27DRAFT_6878981 [Phlegmacium glaucopus]|nr:hypothetical protein BYT27DRAFT_6878981 [Phlegmacium glaucopus]
MGVNKIVVRSPERPQCVTSDLSCITMGKKRVAFTAASTSKQKDTSVQVQVSPPPQSRRKAKHVLRPSPPAKRVQTYSSITTITKQRLHDLDSGRCLITFEKTPIASQQAAHIVARKTSMTVLKGIETMWGISPLNVDSTKNLVTLRADWHLSYDHNDWALVPADNILKKILEHKATAFDEPYPGFNPDELHDYVFVPLPSLRRHYILRQITVFEDEDGDGDQDQDQDQEDQEEEGEEGEGEEGDRGGWGIGSRDEEEGEGEEGEDKQNMVDVENGNATIHIKPFLEFPLLKHHAHPFFVIYNALPKLRKHQMLLRPEHHALLTLMAKIDVIWMSRLSKGPSSSKPAKRRRPSDEPPDDDDDTHDDKPKRKTRRISRRRNSKLPGADQKTYETRSRANINKGKGKTMPAQPPEPPYPTPSPTPEYSTVKASHSKAFLFDDLSEVVAWAAAVAAAGPPEVIDEAVVWSDEEPLRSPIQEWDRWHVPYKQPKQRARFCSSDWPMYFYSLPLWMPSRH